MRLDYLPRRKVIHTSVHHIGQVYVPSVNWILMAASISLVIGFGSSSRLAAAYGIAVTMTMAITTLRFIGVAIQRWRWSPNKAIAIGVPLLLVDPAFLGAQLIKIPHGGWFALAVGIAQFTLMTTWRTGRGIVASELRRGETPVSEFVDDLDEREVVRVPGTAAFLFKDPGATPPALLVNLAHNKVLHEVVLLVFIETTDAPSEHPTGRAVVAAVGLGIWQVHLCFGFVDDPDVPDELLRLELDGNRIEVVDVTNFLGRETVVSTPIRTMNPIREHLFVMQNRTAASAARCFNLPANRVFEVGTTIEI